MSVGDSGFVRWGQASRWQWPENLRKNLCPAGAGRGLCYNFKMSASLFHLVSPFKPAGDQPQAIAELCSGLREGRKDQVLLGVTGSGKTYTIASVIARLPTGPGLAQQVLAPATREFKSYFLRTR